MLIAIEYVICAVIENTNECSISFNALSITEKTNDKIQEGIVIRQEPAENTQTFAGETVKIYVSIGKKNEKISKYIKL